MKYTVYILFLLFQFIIIYFLHLLYQKKKIKIDVIDKPDGLRKIHTQNTPNIGGFFFLIGFIFLLILDLFNFYYIEQELIFFMEGYRAKISFYFVGFLFFLLGYYDDKFNIRSSNKLVILFFLIYIAQILDSSLIVDRLVFSFLDKTIFLDRDLALLFTTFSILVLINAINMYDGKNSQIAIYSIIIIVFLLIRIENLILFSLLVSLFFFFSKNYNGKIFIGNNGTHYLGYVFSFFIIKVYNSYEIKLYADEIFILLSLPGLDLIRLFFKRAVNLKNPLVGDMDHIHHILSLKFTNLHLQLILFSITVISLFLYKFGNFYIAFIFVLTNYVFLILFCKK